MNTAAGSDAPSRLRSTSDASHITSMSRGYAGHVPRPPIASPKVRFSSPIDPVEIATALVPASRPNLGPASYQPPNSVVSDDHGEGIEASTMFNSQNPSPGASPPRSHAVPLTNGTSTAATASTSGILAGGHRLSAENLTIAIQSNQTTGNDAASPRRSALRPSRSSHTNEPERAAGEILGPEGMQRANGINHQPIYSNRTAMGVVEHSMWADNVREDLLRDLLRLRQLAADKENIDGSKTQQEYYDEDLSAILQEAADRNLISPQ